jgi:hypothetical protein
MAAFRSAKPGRRALRSPRKLIQTAYRMICEVKLGLPPRLSRLDCGAEQESKLFVAHDNPPAFFMRNIDHPA